MGRGGVSCGLTMVVRVAAPHESVASLACQRHHEDRCIVWCPVVCRVIRQPSEAPGVGAGGLWVLERAFVLIVAMVSQGCANVRTFQIVHYKLCDLLYIKNISIKMQK